MIILGTKFFYEIGSAESNPVRGRRNNRFFRTFARTLLADFYSPDWHRLDILFIRMNPESKWGQVVGNIVSEWVQMAGLVFLTKRLVEIGSKE